MIDTKDERHRGMTSGTMKITGLYLVARCRQTKDIDLSIFFALGVIGAIGGAVALVDGVLEW
jgi:hypothetical protein